METIKYKPGDLIPSEIFSATVQGDPVSIKWASNVSVTHDDGKYRIDYSDGPLIDRCGQDDVQVNGNGTVVDGSVFPEDCRRGGVAGLLFKDYERKTNGE